MEPRPTITRGQLLAARSGAAVGPLLAPAFLRLTGKDARAYLHRMSTQDLSGLVPGRSAYAAILTAKGHLLAEGHVFAEEGGLLLAVEPAALEAVRAHLRRFVIMDEVAIEDAPELRALPVLGPEGPARLEGRAPGARRLVNGRRGAPCLELWLPAAEGEALRAALVADGVEPLGEEALEALRIAGGVARHGAELAAARLPMEAGLTRAAISFTKGCYVGQEVVMRATARGHLQRGLVLLALPAGAGPGTPLLADGVEVGAVTSAAELPEGRVGLGFLRRAHWREGERLGAAGGEAVVARVVVEETGG
jgi:folate-binding protein YgfZ